MTKHSKKPMTGAVLNKYNMIKESWNQDYAEATAAGKRVKNSGMHPKAEYKHPPSLGTQRWAVQWQKIKRSIKKESDRVAELVKVGKGTKEEIKAA